MIKIFGLLANLIGIGGKSLQSRAKLKELKQIQEYKILEAQTEAQVNRIKSNTTSDNEIDLITAQNKRFTNKDEVVTYLFLIPLIVATLTPFYVIATTSFTANDLIELISQSYDSLNELPIWYKYGLGAVIIDVLGFRSFARKLTEKYLK